MTAFTELLDSSGGEEEDGYKALTALGLISAVQSLVKSAFSKPELLKQMESVLIETIASIFQNGIMGKHMYSTCTNCTCTCTCVDL